MFAAWQLDTLDVIENACRADFLQWKVGKFIKQEDEYAEVCNLVRKNYVFLKNAFTTLTSRTNFPYMSTIDLARLLTDAELIDPVTTIGICDTQLIAARKENDAKTSKMQNQAHLNINRFEFIETLVRIAGQKYKQ